jgi:hypothetical protein
MSVFTVLPDGTRKAQVFISQDGRTDRIVGLTAKETEALERWLDNLERSRSGKRVELHGW